ncbi:hypothetical protein V6N12_029955 [Hibiscus sabdariffa]
MVDEYGQWLWGLFEDLLPYEILLRIAVVKAPAYDMACEAYLISDFLIQRPPRVKTFLWLAYLAKLLTNEERFYKHLTSDCHCSVCGAKMENFDHVFHMCPTTYTLWSSLVRPESVFDFFSMPFKDWVFAIHTQSRKFVSDHVAWDYCLGA